MTGGIGSPLLWRWHITMATSIFHRASIFGLYLSALLLAGWLLALAGGPQSYGAYTAALGSPLGLLVLFPVLSGASFASYHDVFGDGAPG